MNFHVKSEEAKRIRSKTTPELLERYEEILAWMTKSQLDGSYFPATLHFELANIRQELELRRVPWPEAS